MDEEAVVHVVLERPSDSRPHVLDGLAADASWNDSFWKNDHFNELLLKARSETDQAKRAAMYAEMQEIVSDDGGVVVLMFYNYVNAHAKSVAHPDVIAPNWDVDGMKITKRWWFA